jgi:fused
MSNVITFTPKLSFFSGLDPAYVFYSISVNKNEHNTRLVCNILALLGCALREMPENAELVENIVFDGRIDLAALMKNENELIRLRSCILLRLLGRYSCYSLKSVWKSSIRETIEALLYDSSADVRNVSLMS